MCRGPLGRHESHPQPNPRPVCASTGRSVCSVVLNTLRRRSWAMAQARPGYGRKWKKWLGIYVAVAAVVYLIVFLVFSMTEGAGAASATDAVGPPANGRGRRFARSESAGAPVLIQRQVVDQRCLRLAVPRHHRDRPCLPSARRHPPTGSGLPAGTATAATGRPACGPAKPAALPAGGAGPAPSPGHPTRCGRGGWTAAPQEHQRQADLQRASQLPR